MIIENNQVIVTSEASFCCPHTALGYIYHHNYWKKQGFEVKVVYDDFYVDKNFYFRHYEQNESALEQFEKIKNLLIIAPPYKNTFEHVIIDHDKFVDLKYRFHKSINDLYIKKFGNRLFPFKPRVLWPLRNHLHRKAKKVAIMRTKPEGYYTPDPHKKTHAPEWEMDWGFWEETLRDRFDVTEINYRLPMSETLYHLATSEFVFASQPCMAYALSVGLQTPSMAFDFKAPSGFENYDHLISKDSFFLLDDQGFLDSHVEQAKKNIANMLSDWEKRFA